MHMTGSIPLIVVNGVEYFFPGTYWISETTSFVVEIR